MAGQNDDAVLTAAVGYILVANEGTTAPTVAAIQGFDPVAGLAGWTSVGHTSEDDLPEFGSDGGDTETKGSWQNKALRTIETSALVDFVTFKMLQFDTASLELYYGQTSGAADTTGKFRVSKAGGVTRKALLIVVVDGDTNIALWAPKTDIRRDDSITLATDEFGTLPVRSTFLEYLDTSVTPNEKVYFDWINVLDEPVGP